MVKGLVGLESFLRVGQVYGIILPGRLGFTARLKSFSRFASLDCSLVLLNVVVNYVTLETAFNALATGKLFG